MLDGPAKKRAGRQGGRESRKDTDKSGVEVLR